MLWPSDVRPFWILDCLLVTRKANALAGDADSLVCTAAWQTKRETTFSRTIDLVRRSLWRRCYFEMSKSKAKNVKIPHPLRERPTDGASYAA
jgi:hypothetical protein